MHYSPGPRIPLIDSPLVSWFVSPEIRGDDTYEAYYQRTVAFIALALSMWGPVFALMYWFVLDIPTLAVGLLGATASWIGALGLLRRWGSTLWPSQLICASVMAFLTWSAWKTGGIHSPGAFALIIVPILATAYHREQRWAWMWSGMATVVVVVFVAVAVRRGWEMPTALGGIEDITMLYASSIVGVLIAMVVVFAIRHRFESWLLTRTRRQEAERRRAERALRRVHERARIRSRKSFQSLMEKSPDGIVVHRERRILYANPAFRELIGFDGESMEGISLERFVRPQDTNDWERGLERLKKRESLEIRDREIRCFDDTTLPVDVKAFEATFDGEVVQISIVRDLSEARELRAKMMEMDRMIAVGTLASGVAHEINNPLSFVHANLEFLLRRMCAGDCEEACPVFKDLVGGDVREVVLDSLEGTNRIRDIVSDLRTMAPSELKELEPMEVEQTLETALNMASNQIEQRARVVRDYDDLPTIESDESGLAQVFLNLLVNAAQAIPEGTPEDDEIHVSTRRDDSDVVVEISDTGEGIAESDIDRIFDPFFSTKPQGQGMGLGLSICRTTIRELGGHIEVDSEVGRGSTFRVIVPGRVAANESSEFSVPDDPFGDKTGRIVVIDDEEKLLRSLERQLGEQFEVETYDKAEDALRQLESRATPEMILCDLQMPEVSGVEFLRRLEPERPDCCQRLVFITGGAFTEEVREFVEETEYRVLRKPLVLKDLMEAIEELD